MTQATHYSDKENAIANETAKQETVFIHGKHVRTDGTFDTFWTKEVPVKECPTPYHKAGLSYTASGYGSRIPTTKKVFLNGKWRRVYCRIYSNVGTLFLRTANKSEIITVQD